MYIIAHINDISRGKPPRCTITEDTGELGSQEATIFRAFIVGADQISQNNTPVYCIFSLLNPGEQSKLYQGVLKGNPEMEGTMHET